MQYNEGSVIVYVSFGGGRRTVKVESKEEDIKNGRPGFDGILIVNGKETEDGVWGYDDQIVRVLS